MTAPHLALGHVVAGKYTIRALLGFTGEVATYYAVGGSGEGVVVKLYDPAIGQRADVMTQLDRVRGQTAQLPAHYVVPVIDAGYDAGTGAPFSVTEYLQVPSLAKLVETGPLSPEVVANIMRGIALVLESAQTQHLLHHALKPANIFVGPAPHFPVRITDFGASVVRRTSPTHEAYAQSAPWWAPEQLQPAAVLGPATDVFACALVAFYALTGRSYWISCQSSPPDLPAWQMEVMGQRVPVSQRASELGWQMSSGLDGLFARAMSVSQSERPGVGELANAMGSAAVRTAAAGDNAQTMALPEGYPSAGNYTPPPAFGPTPAPVGASTNVAAGGQHYPAVAAVSQQPEVTPGLPPFPAPAKKKTSGTMLAVIIGITAAVLLGGAGVFFLFMRTSATDSSDAAGSAGATSSAPDSGDNGDTTAPSAAPAGSAKPSSDAGVENDGGGGNAAEPKKVAVTLKCIPECDSLLVDNEEVADPNGRLRLIPGKHTVKAIKNGYVIRVDTIEIETAKAFEKEYHLVKVGPVPTKKPPCGQFLKPCP
ncbi:MAG: protein kinase [Pseudomonadota bacterium]